METKKLIPLIVILGVLIAVGVLTKRGPGQQTIDTEAGLALLVPKDFLAADVNRIEVYFNKFKDQAIDIRRKGDKDWSLASLHSAQANAKKVGDLLKAVKKLEGEFRSSDKAVLADYQLKEDQALHLVCYKKDRKVPWVHLLVGKKAGSGNCFLRTKDGDAVHTANKDFRADFGLWDEKKEKAPEASEWLEKKFLALDKPKVAAVDLRWPHKAIRLERREKPAKKVDEKEGGKGKTPKPKPVYAWHLAAGPKHMRFKPTAVDEVLRGFRDLQAKGVKDPKKLAKWGLDKPDHTAKLRLEDGKEIVVKAHRAKPGGDAYVMIEGRPTVYEVASWEFEKAFPKGKTLFDLPKIDIQQHKLAMIEVKTGKTAFRIERRKVGGSEKWLLVDPAGFTVETSKAGDVAWGVSGLTVEDWADTATGGSLGFDRGSTIRYALQGKESGELAVGGAATAIEGSYARLPGKPHVFVLGKSSLDRALVPMGKLFDLDIFAVKSSDIRGVEVRGAAETYEVAVDKAGAWVVKAGGKSLKPKLGEITSYLENIAKAKAEDVDLGQGIPAGAKESLVLHRKSGKDVEATLIHLGKDRRLLILPHRKERLLIGGSTYDSLFPRRSHLVATVAPKKEAPKKKGDGS